jgi:hypothetical protein
MGAEGCDAYLAPEALQDDAHLLFRAVLALGGPLHPADEAQACPRSWAALPAPVVTSALSSLAPRRGSTYRCLGARTSPLLSVRNCLHNMSLSLTPNSAGEEAKLCYAGHVLTEKQNGLVVDSACSNVLVPGRTPDHGKMCGSPVSWVDVPDLRKDAGLSISVRPDSMEASI